MAQNLKDFYKENQTEPVLTTVGRGMRPMTDALQERDRIKKTLPVIAGALANQAPKVLGVPAAGIANAASRGIADFQTGFTGQKYRPQQFEAKSFTDLFGAQKPAIAAPLAAPPAAPAGLPRFQRPETTYTPGAGLPSMAQIASDKARANAAQVASDTQMGVQTPGATGINVQRQANGVLAFSGQGGGDGTGAVNYTGLPNWTSDLSAADAAARDVDGKNVGGAGKGSVGSGWNLAEQNARMATALQGIRDTDRQAKFDNLAGAKELGPFLQQQMANKNAMGVAKLNAETSRYGHDQGLAGEMARVEAAKYGTDVGAQVNREGLDVERDKVRATLLAAQTKAAAGKPLSPVEQLGLQIFEGKTFTTKAARDAAMADWIKMFQKGNPFEQAMADMYAAQQGAQ